MPCRVYTDAEEASFATKALTSTRARIKTLEEELDKVTALLCQVLTEFPQAITMRVEHDELSEWWNEHQRKDKLRLEAEAQAKQEAEDRELFNSLRSKYGW